MTDTTDADDLPPAEGSTDTSTGMTVLVWAFRAVQFVLAGLGIILLVGATQMSAVGMVVVAVFVGVLLLLALVVEFIAVRPCKGRA